MHTLPDICTMNVNRRIVQGFLLVVLFFSNASFAQQFKPGTLQGIADGEQLYKSKLVSANKTRSAISNDIHITYARFQWYVDPALDTISGAITYFYRTLSAVDTLVFNMNDTLINDSAYYHNVTTAFTHTAALLKIGLPSTLSTGVNDSITIYYHGNPPTDGGFGSFEIAKHDDSIPVMWTLSEPYGASNWWPCKNNLDDKIDSCSILITTPNLYVASSNGHINSISTDGVYNYAQFTVHYPIATYLVSIAASDYQYFDTTLALVHDTLLVTHEVYPENYNDFQSTAASLYSVIYFYDSLYGKYPFSKDRYGQTQFSWGDGGMEHQTNSFVSGNGYELDVHELAHQWFGDKITCGSWTDIWLNEGWAVYSSGLCYERFFNNIYWSPFKLGRIQKVISLPTGSVWVDDTTSVSRIFDSRLTYAKGAMVLNMLRWEMGDSNFFKGVRYYVADTNVCYKFARTKQFQQDLAAYTHSTLDTFINQWFYGQGYPTYNFTYTQAGNYLTIHLKQTVSDSSATHLFYMHLPLMLKSSTGADTMLRIWNDSATQTYTVHVPFTVDSLLFDPQYNIVAGNHTPAATATHNIVPVTASMALYPNPASSILSIVHPQSCTMLTLYDVLGQVVMQSQLTVTNNFDNISVSALTPGVYIVQLQKADGTRLVQQFVKQ